MGTDNCLTQAGSERESSLLRIDSRLAPEWGVTPCSEAVTSEFWRRSFKTTEVEAQDVGEEQLFKDFFLSMVALNPNNRLSADALLDHPYLRDVPFCHEIS